MSKDEALGSTNINLRTKGRGVSQETRVTPLTQSYAGVKKGYDAASVQHHLLRVL